MKDLVYTIYFANRTHMTIRESKPDDCPKSIASDFHEALGTGMLVIGNGEAPFFLIPVANIMRIECFPADDDDSDDRQYNLERLFEEDDEDDDDYDDLDEEDEGND